MVKQTKKPTTRPQAFASLNLVKLPDIATMTATVDPVTARRNALVTRLDEQKMLLSNPALTRTVKEGGKEKAVKIKSWVRPVGDGTFAFFVKSGLKVVELAPGLSAVAIKELNELPDIIDVLKTATLNGELDNQLATAAEASRRKPKV